MAKNNYVCKVCGKDLTDAVKVFGKEALAFHGQLHTAERAYANGFRAGYQLAINTLKKQHRL